MNKILKTLLSVGEAVATSTIPGAQVIDTVVRDIVTKKPGVENEIPDLSKAVIDAVEQLGSHDIADAQKFHDGVAMLESGFKLVADSLKHKDGQPAAGV